MSTCSSCNKAIEHNEIHLVRGGEERRARIAKVLNTKVSLCGNPPTNIDDLEEGEEDTEVKQ